MKPLRDHSILLAIFILLLIWALLDNHAKWVIVIQSIGVGMNFSLTLHYYLRKEQKINTGD